MKISAQNIGKLNYPLFEPSWKMFGTRSDLERQIGSHFEVVQGWTESETDTVLALQVPDGSDEWYVYCWNGIGIRANLAAVLGMPVYHVSK